MRSERAAPLCLASAFALFGIVWTLASDYLLANLVTDAALTARLQTAKGVTFVLLGSLLIFAVSRHGRRAQRRLLEALTRNSRLLQQAQRNAALGSWEYRDGFRWSAEALELLGRDAGSAHGSLEQLLNWLHPAERQAVQRAFQALFTQQRPLAIGARLHQPHRPQATWLMLRGEVDGDGQFLGTLQDISAQKRDESALRDSEQRFRQLFEQTPRIAVQGYDRERRVVYWNPASTQLYGYSLQEAMGKRLEELLVPPQARNQVASALNHWLLGGPAPPAAEQHLQRKDGSRVWVYSSRSLLQNSREQPELYCVDIDLSEQKQIDEGLRSSEASYRGLVDRLGEVILLLEAGGHLSFLNPAWERLSGYVGYESLGRPLMRFLQAADGARLAQQLGAMARGEQAELRDHYRLLTRHGRLRWTELRLERRPDGRLGGTLRDHHDEHLQQQLRRARNALLEELLERQPLQQILDGLCRRLQELNPLLRASLLLQDRQRRLRVASAPDLPAGFRASLDGLQVAKANASCGHAASSGELVVAADLGSHPYWHRLREATQAAGLHACWSMPFKDAQGRPLGTLGVYVEQPCRPSSSDIALLGGFAQMAGLAVQHAGAAAHDRQSAD